MSKHTKESKSFDQWFKMLNKMAIDRYDFDCDGMESSGQEFYDDGYTPREALDEDTYAGL